MTPLSTPLPSPLNKILSLYRRDYFRELWVLGLPLIAAHITQFGLDLIDLVMIGHLGITPLAGATLGNVVILLALVLCVGIFNGLGILIANAHGAGNHKTIHELTSSGAWLALVLSVLIIIFMLTIPHALSLVYQRPTTLKFCSQYLAGLAWGAPAILLFICTRELSVALRYPRLILVVALAATLINIVLNELLIYGHGFPELGVYGAGLATSIANWLMYLGLSIWIYRKTGIATYPKYQAISKTIQRACAILRLGLPIGFTILFEAGLFSLSSMIANLFGDVAMAAHGIVQQSCTIPFLIYLGLSQATSIQVSTLCGQKRWHDIRYAAFAGFSMALGVSIISCLTFLTQSATITYLFIGMHTPATLKLYWLTKQFSICVASFQILDSVLTISNGVLRGIQDTFVPMIIAGICYWVIGLIGEYQLAFQAHLGPVGIWIALAFSLCLAGIAMFWRFVVRYRLLMQHKTL